MGDVIKFGSIAVDRYTGIKTISDQVNNNNYTSLDFPVGTKYQVPAGKIFRIGLLVWNADTINSSFNIGYGDDSVNDSVTPPTNLVALVKLLPAEIANAKYETPIYLEIPSLKYPYIESRSGKISLMAIGIEE